MINIIKQIKHSVPLGLFSWHREVHGNISIKILRSLFNNIPFLKIRILKQSFFFFSIFSTLFLFSQVQISSPLFSQKLSICFTPFTNTAVSKGIFKSGISKQNLVVNTRAPIKCHISTKLFHLIFTMSVGSKWGAQIHKRKNEERKVNTDYIPLKEFSRK